jgi:hypothetical protein
MAPPPKDHQPSDSAKQKLSKLLARIRPLTHGLQQVPLTAVTSSIGIISAMISITAAVLVPFWWSLTIIVIMGVFILAFLWPRFPVANQSRPTVLRALCSSILMVLTVLLLWIPMKTKYLKEHPPPSIVFVVPGFWSPSPVGRWFMMIQHCGLDPLYNLQIIFDDTDRKNQISTHDPATPSEIAESSVTLEFNEIDPIQVQPAKLFPWTPVNPDLEHYSVRIISRSAAFDETLEIARVSEKWRYRIKISDVTTSQHTQQPIIDCQDAEFPESSGKGRPMCFPYYVAQPQNVCG